MPNNEKNAEPAVRDAQSTAARRRRRRHTPHGITSDEFFLFSHTITN